MLRTNHNVSFTRASGLSLLCCLIFASLGGRLAYGQESATFDAAPQDLFRAMEMLNHRAILESVEVPGALRATNSNGDTPLHIAVDMGAALWVELFLAYGADPAALNDAGMTPVRVMRTWRPNDRREARRLVTYAFVQHYQHQNVDAPNAVRRAQARFFLAASMRDIAMARAALDAGADPNGTRNPRGQTVMHLVTSSQMVPKLIAMGVDVNRLDRRGDSALTFAIKERRTNVVSALLDARAPIMVEEKQSDLSFAARGRGSVSSELVELLVNAGAPVRQEEWMAALRSKNGKTVRALLRHEGPFDPQSKEGEERMAVAVKLGGDSVLAALHREPSLASYLERQTQHNATARNGQLASAGGWMRIHFLAFTVLITLFALSAVVPAWAFFREKRFAYLLLVGLGTAAMTHLFLFTPTIETFFSEFRLFGERLPNMRYVAYAIFDGSAFFLGLAVGYLAWLALSSRPRSLLLSLPAFAVLLCTVAVLVAHNLQAVHWPTAAYQRLTGYDDYVAEKEQKKKLQQEARKEATILASETLAREPFVPLFAAIKDNNVAGVEAALATGLPVDSRNRSGQTALYYAVSTSRLETIPILLAAGADVGALHKRGHQPLHQLHSTGLGAQAPDILKLLLDAGADVNAVTDEGGSPLCRALESTSPRAATIKGMLLDSGATLRFTDRCAPDAYARDPAILAYVEVAPGTLDAVQPFAKLDDEFGPYGASPLWQAAYSRDLNRVRLLLALGANVESRDTRRGMTPLQAAVDQSRYSPDKGRPMVSLLLNKGADYKAVAWDGSTFAELDEHGLVAEWLADSGDAQ